MEDFTELLKIYTFEIEILKIIMLLIFLIHERK